MSGLCAINVHDLLMINQNVRFIPNILFNTTMCQRQRCYRSDASASACVSITYDHPN